MIEYHNKLAVREGCYTSLRCTCSGCYEGLGKLTVDREREHKREKDNSAMLYVCRGGGRLQSTLLLLLRRKTSFLLGLGQPVVRRSSSGLDY